MHKVYHTLNSPLQGSRGTDLGNSPQKIVLFCFFPCESSLNITVSITVGAKPNFVKNYYGIIYVTPAISGIFNSIFNIYFIFPDFFQIETNYKVKSSHFVFLGCPSFDLGVPIVKWNMPPP